MTRIAKPCGDTSKTVRQQPLAAFLGRATAATPAPMRKVAIGLRHDFFTKPTGKSQPRKRPATIRPASISDGIETALGAP
jgi:hypothetical protein